MAAVLGLSASLDDHTAPSAETLHAEIKQRYTSPLRERSTAALRDTQRWLLGHVKRLQNKPETSVPPQAGATTADEQPLTTEGLVLGLAEHLGVYDPDVDHNTLQLYICQYVIAAALLKMSPAQRADFFAAGNDLGQALSVHNPARSTLKAPLRTAAILGAAHLPGASLTTAAGGALALVTQSLGLSLPFALAAGLQTTAAWLLGPGGWLATGAWITWAVTGPEWKKLLPVVLLIIATRNQKGER